jgi:hypothetical protein
MVAGGHDVGGFLNPSFNGIPGMRGRGMSEATLFLPARAKTRGSWKKINFPTGLWRPQNPNKIEWESWRIVSVAATQVYPG